ncbi:MAG: UDP-N-acetylmuramate dehydrogenase [Clostridiales bacterium]|nr:UDP-N-acetylmuramate dehydrogenase [Clostridiales bacterium]
MDYTALKSYAETLGCVCREQVPMSEHTSFAIGGPADLFLEAPHEEDLGNLLAACRKWEIPAFTLGNGSNLLVSDDGIRGAVLHIGGGLADIRLAGEGEIICGAGAKLSRLCAFALEHSLTGLEFAWGIPGSAGGAAFMNAGAYDSEMKNVLLSCRHIGPDGAVGRREGEALDLSYRHSAYADSGEVITELRLGLRPGEPEAIRARMDELMARRKSKQPLEYPSAGSVFKRPAGNYAGALIEQCGLKGYTIGGAQVSEKHAGFIVNIGGATCSDVRRLIAHIQEQVFLQTGIELQTEIKAVGIKQNG